MHSPTNKTPSDGFTTNKTEPSRGNIKKARSHWFNSHLGELSIWN